MMTSSPERTEKRDLYIDQVLARIPQIDALVAARQATGMPAWLVGGAVRDLLLDRTPCDVDITTQHPEPLARRFAALIDARVVPLDTEFGVWRVAVRGGERFYDFCRFRDADIIGDLRGRDFTFNAMALRLPEGEKPGGLLDPFHGLDDLNAGLLRMVSPRAFHDDPARILRAFRFMSELRLELDTPTRQAMEALVSRLPDVAAERLLAEWWKLCAGRHAATAVRAMSETGALGVLFPELQACKGVTQNTYHHLDVWEHSMLAMAEMLRLLHDPEAAFQDLLPDFAPLVQDAHRRGRLVCISLLHDIGKPQTRSVKHGRVHFYGHEAAGARLAARLAARLRMSHRDAHVVTSTIREHLRPLLLLTNDGQSISRKAMINYFEGTEDVALEVMALSLADKAAARGPAADPAIRDRQLALYRELLAFYHTVYQPALQAPVLTGADLIETLHLQPGPHFGDLLSQARRKQLLGQLPTRDKALRWAEKQVGRVQTG